MTANLDVKVNPRVAGTVIGVHILLNHIIMSGRGDNNKHGSAGRGASNQSNQPFIPDGNPEPASNHNKHDNNRQTLNISVDGVPYVVETEAFSFNGQERYNIKVNGGDSHVFVYDPDIRQFRSLDDDATTLPDALEESISNSLLSGRR